MSKKKKHKNELAKAMETLIDLGIFDEMVKKGEIQFFQSREEMNGWMKSNEIKEDTVLTIDGNEGRRLTKKIGRNQKCICGSGLKYKKCCLNNNQYGIG
jgi:uncharacterized protein YchJ